MSDPSASPIRFVGVTGDQLGGEHVVGDVVTINYAGTSYKVRVTSRYDDYDDFGTALPKYDLEVVTAP